MTGYCKKNKCGVIDSDQLAKRCSKQLHNVKCRAKGSHESLVSDVAHWHIKENSRLKIYSKQSALRHR